MGCKQPQITHPLSLVLLSVRSSSHPLDGFTSEKVGEVEDKRPPMREFPPLPEFWGEEYWAMVKAAGRSGIRPGRAMTYGPSASMYKPMGRSLYLPWKTRGWERTIRTKKGRRTAEECMGVKD